MRKILSISSALIAVMFLFAVEVKVCYLNEKLSPVIKTFEVEGDVVTAIFRKLASPPQGLRTYVPSGVLRAYFFVGNTMIIDLEGNKLKGFSFEGERYFLHQVLYTIFVNFRNVASVYFIVDDERKNVLVRYVDIRFSFPREVWEKWPIR